MKTHAARDLTSQVTLLLEKWREETAHLSSSRQITEHPAYQELIALGPAVLPHLFRDLAHSLDGHLALALKSITGVQPVPEEHRGKVKQVGQDWLAWAVKNGYSW